MKMVVNKCFGGFGVKDSYAEELGLDPFDNDTNRLNSQLIELVESGIDCADSFAKLQVVEIPDTATDYEVNDYDGFESVIYVVDGKLHHI